MIQEFTFDELKVSQKASFKRKITKEDINLFCRITDDHHPLHTDSEYASKTKFKKPIVHGMYVNSLLSTLIGTYLPGKHALVLSVSSQFVNPAYEDDTLAIEGIVKKKQEYGKVVEIDASILNQDKVQVLVAKIKIQLRE